MRKEMIVTYEKKDTLEHIKYELLEGGDATILWFLPKGGAYVFPGDARGYDIIRSTEQLESYYCPSFTRANREDIVRICPGDGPTVVEGTREELYTTLDLRFDSALGALGEKSVLSETR